MADGMAHQAYFFDFDRDGDLMLRFVKVIITAAAAYWAKTVQRCLPEIIIRVLSCLEAGSVGTWDKCTTVIRVRQFFFALSLLWVRRRHCW
jgi:hypothetical protein